VQSDEQQFGGQIYALKKTLYEQEIRHKKEIANMEMQLASPQTMFPDLLNGN
jgi:hypothetical protein